MQTLMVVGGTGLLGSKLVQAAARRYKVVATSRSQPDSLEGVAYVQLHKERSEDAVATLRDVAPDFVIDTAAVRDVDLCEQERDLAWQVNMVGTAELAKGAREVGSRYVYISTDYVFDGMAGPYGEDDHPSPVNYYGVTKLSAERAVLAANRDNQVVRPSILFGRHDRRLNFATWVLASLLKGEKIQAAKDFYGSPTYAESLAEAILRLLEEAGGVFHLTPSECISRLEFAHRIADVFDLDKSLIEPVTRADLGLRAERPKRTCLVNERAARVGISVVDVDEGIRRMRGHRPLQDVGVLGK